MLLSIHQIWDLSDPNGRGSLDKDGFFVALKLVGLAQAGHDINMRNIFLDPPNPPKVVSELHIFYLFVCTKITYLFDFNCRAKYQKLCHRKSRAFHRPAPTGQSSQLTVRDMKICSNH